MEIWMPDLSHESALDFWKTFMGGSVAHIIQFIEHTEDWVQLSAEDSAALEDFGKHLDNINSDTKINEQDVAEACATLHLSQKLRVMQALDAVSPGFATRMITSAEKNAMNSERSKMFLQRNLIFERMRIISRVFSKSRLQLVQKLYEN